MGGDSTSRSAQSSPLLSATVPWSACCMKHSGSPAQKGQRSERWETPGLDMPPRSVHSSDISLDSSLWVMVPKWEREVEGGWAGRNIQWHGEYDEARFPRTRRTGCPRPVPAPPVAWLLPPPQPPQELEFIISRISTTKYSINSTVVNIWRQAATDSTVA